MLNSCIKLGCFYLLVNLLAREEGFAKTLALTSGTTEMRGTTADIQPTGHLVLHHQPYQTRSQVGVNLKGPLSLNTT